MLLLLVLFCAYVSTFETNCVLFIHILIIWVPEFLFYVVLYYDLKMLRQILYSDIIITKNSTYKIYTFEENLQKYIILKCVLNLWKVFKNHLILVRLLLLLLLMI